MHVTTYNVCYTPMIDVHVHYFMKGVVDKVDASCTVPCFTVLVFPAKCCVPPANNL